MLAGTAAPMSPIPGANPPVSPAGLPVSQLTPASTPPGSPPATEADAAPEEVVEDPALVRNVDAAFVERIEKAVEAAGEYDPVEAMRQIGLAMHNFASDHNERFPALDGLGEQNSPNGLSWRVMLLPYLGEDELFREFKLNEAWDSPANKKLLKKMPAVFGKDEEGRTRIHLITGLGAPFQNGQGLEIKKITDGTSNTIMLAEAGTDRADFWTKPRGLNYDASTPATTFGKLKDTVQVVMCDASSRQVPLNLSYLANLIKHDDGQIIPIAFHKDFTPKRISSTDEASLPALPPLEPLPETLDARFIPRDASLVVVVSPRRIIESELVQSILTRMATKGETTSQTLDRIATAARGSTFKPQNMEEFRVIVTGLGGQASAANSLGGKTSLASPMPQPIPGASPVPGASPIPSPASSPLPPPGAPAMPPPGFPIPGAPGSPAAGGRMPMGGMPPGFTPPGGFPGGMPPGGFPGGMPGQGPDSDFEGMSGTGGMNPDVLLSTLPPDSFGAYIRTSVPLPIEDMTRDVLRGRKGVEITKIYGVPVIVNPSVQQHIAFLNEKEVLIGSEKMIRHLLEVREDDAKASPVVATLQTSPPSMLMVAAAAPAGEKLEMLTNALSMAGPVAMMVPQLAETNSVRLSVDLEQAEFLSLSLGFISQNVARTFGDVAKGFLAQGQQQGKMFQATLDRDDPSQSIQADLIGEIASGSAVSQTENLVSLRIQRPASLNQAVEAFEGQLSAAQQMTMTDEDLPPMERLSKGMLAYVDEKGHLPAASGPGELEVKKGASEDPFGRPSPGQKPGQKSPRGRTPSGNAPGNLSPSNMPLNTLPQPGNPTASGTGNQTQQTGPGGKTLPSAEEKLAAAIAKNKGLSWRVHILPYIGQKQLYEQFRLEERWDGPNNKRLITEMPAIFGDDPAGKTRIHMIVGNETLFKGGKSPDLDSLRDDPAYIITLIEVGTEKADFWSKPGGLPFDPKNPLRCLGKPDEDQPEFQVIMLDGAITTVSTDISEEEFRALVQPSDGKPFRKSELHNDSDPDDE